MKLIFNKILIILFFALSSALNMSGQNDYARHLEIMSQTNLMIQDKRFDDAMTLLRKNKELFQYDAITQFWYDWLNGVILYKTDKYSEARPYITDAISFLDANQNELADPNITNFLQVYYYASKIDYRLGADRDVLIKGLEHAKYIYEIAGATSDIVYSWITSDLNGINNIDLAADALNLFMKRDYNQAIPLLHKVIDYYQTNRTTDYIHLATWMKSLGMA